MSGSSTCVRFVNLRQQRTLHIFHPQRYPTYGKDGLLTTLYGSHNKPINVKEGGAHSANQARKLRVKSKKSRPASAAAGKVRGRSETEENKYKRGWMFHSNRSSVCSDRSWKPCKNPFLTHCKFRETIIANHNHHYNIARKDILAYYPVERDEQPVEIPKPPPPPKKIEMPKPKQPVLVPDKKPEPPKKIPIKEYPYCGPGISVRLEPIIKRGKPIVEVIEEFVPPPVKKVCIRCTVNYPDHDGIVCSGCIRCRVCDICPPDPELDGICRPCLKCLNCNIRPPWPEHVGGEYEGWCLECIPQPSEPPPEPPAVKVKVKESWT